MSTEKRTGTHEYHKFTTRMVRSYGRKALAGDLDTTALEYMADLQREVDAQMVATVAALRSEAGGGYSWAQIGEAMGMTRTAAFKRYAHLVEDLVETGEVPEAARVPGGQPAHLR
jgi:tellurite resistance protein